MYLISLLLFFYPWKKPRVCKKLEWNRNGVTLNPGSEQKQNWIIIIIIIITIIINIVIINIIKK